MSKQLLDLRDYGIELLHARGATSMVHDVDLSVRRGEVLGIVGESGSGKSLTMRGVFGLLPPEMRARGSVCFQGQELLGQSPRALRALRGSKMSIIFQDPLTALNPVMTVGAQIVEAIRIHDRSVSRQAAQERAVALMRMVAIPLPEQRVAQYPHEFSGGMRQRAAIAMSMANDPDLLVADEPTTALDVTVQAQIMDVLRRLRDEKGVGVILITHDLGLLAGIADQVAVMYAGRVVERAAVDELFAAPRHPYTRGLLASLSRIDKPTTRLFSIGGAPPSLEHPPTGCAFHPRCPEVDTICRSIAPPLLEFAGGAAACHRAATPVELGAGP
jgi:peptide/nickel transport system ATP-binding protein